MKILSVNVNNFGGINNKPLLKDYKLDNGEYNFKDWNQSVDIWRTNNKNSILTNMEIITNLAKDFDIVFFHEVDTNCSSWDALLKSMSQQYNWEPANGVEKNVYSKGRKSISCLFVKKEIKYKYEKNNFLNNQRNVEIEVGDTHIIGLHMFYEIEDWESLILKYKSLQDEKLLIIGDLNVFDEGTPRREKFNELLNCGALDIWLKQGECNNIPTANTNKRIDYALSTPKLYENGVNELILNFIRYGSFTDHAAIAVTYND